MSYSSQSHERPPETVLASKIIQAERKTITVAFCENSRGKFIRITEELGNRRNQIIVPETAIDNLVDAIDEVAPGDLTLSFYFS